MTPGPANKKSSRRMGIKSGATSIFWLPTLLLVALLGFPETFFRSAQAQNLQLPGAADPARIEQPEFDDDDDVFELDLSISVQEGCTPPIGSEDEELDFEDLTLVGNSVIDTSALEQHWAELRGESITMTQLYEICALVSRDYQDAGWMLSWALFPAQDVDDGVFTLRVVEGFINEIVIENADDNEQAVHSREALEKLFEPILHFRPTRIDILERYLLLANDLAGINVQSVLRPSANVQGATRLTLQTTEKRVSGAYLVNNRGSKFAGPVTNTFSANLNSPFGRGGKIGATAVIASRPQEQKFVSLQGVMPINNEGSKIAGSVSFSKSRPGFTLDALNIDSTSKQVKVSYLHAYKRSVDESIIVNADFTVSEAKTVLGTGALVSHDKTRRLDFGVNWKQNGFLDGLNSVTARLRLPIHAFGGSDPDKDTVSRADANPWAPSLLVNATHIRGITGALTLQASGSAQLATDALLSGDEFGVGGQAFGRAFDASELTGDYGVAGALELRHPIPFNDWLPEDTPQEWRLINSMLGYGFLDGGRVWNFKTSGDAADQSLVSTGIGLRSISPGGVSLNAELAKPLVKGLNTENNQKKLKGYLGLVVSF